MDGEAWRATVHEGHKELDMNERLTHTHTHTHTLRKESAVPVPGCVVRDIKFPWSICKLNFIENSRLFGKQNTWNF